MASESGRLDLNKMSMVWHYLKYEFWAGCLIRCCWRENEREKLEALVIEKGSECLDEDFNFLHYMERMRLSNWETEQWGMTNKLNYNEYPDHKLVLVYTQGEEEAARQMEESKKQI